jgi:hypothetical protein
MWLQQAVSAVCVLCVCVYVTYSWRKSKPDNLKWRLGTEAIEAGNYRFNNLLNATNKNIWLKISIELIWGGTPQKTGIYF